jgi:hypothetical protein
MKPVLLLIMLISISLIGVVPGWSQNDFPFAIDGREIGKKNGSPKTEQTAKKTPAKPAKAKGNPPPAPTKKVDKNKAAVSLENLETERRHEKSELSGLEYSVYQFRGILKNSTAQMVTDLEVEFWLLFQDGREDHFVSTVAYLLPHETRDYLDRYQSETLLRSFRINAIRYQNLAPTSKKAAPIWQARLKPSEDEAIIIQALKNLAIIRDSSSLASMIDLLGHDQPKIQAAARDALQNFGRTRDESLQAEIQQNLLSALRTKSVPHKRQIIELLADLQVADLVYPAIFLLSLGQAEVNDSVDQALKQLGPVGLERLAELIAAPQVEAYVRPTLIRLGAPAREYLQKLAQSRNLLSSAQLEQLAQEKNDQVALQSIMSVLAQAQPPLIEPSRLAEHLRFGQSFLAVSSETGQPEEKNDQSKISSIFQGQDDHNQNDTGPSSSQKMIYGLMLVIMASLAAGVGLKWGW